MTDRLIKVLQGIGEILNRPVWSDGCVLYVMNRRGRVLSWIKLKGKSEREILAEYMEEVGCLKRTQQ